MIGCLTSLQSRAVLYQRDPEGLTCLIVDLQFINAIVAFFFLTVQLRSERCL
jgi:hypothetical protein